VNKEIVKKEGLGGWIPRGMRERERVRDRSGGRLLWVCNSWESLLL